MIQPPVKMMLILIGENDSWKDRPLAESLMFRLHELGVAGATVNKGVMGMGSHRKMHHKGLFGSSEDPPLTITIFENESKLREIAAQIRDMAPKAFMVMLDAEELP